MSSLTPHSPLFQMNASFHPWDDTHREEQAGGAAAGDRIRIGPLSPEERAIWDAHEAELNGAHHRIFVARIRARVEGERLELALERLVERHAELRTTFHAMPSGPQRRLRGDADFRLEFVDARRWSEAELDEIVRLTARQPMDLSASAFRAVFFTRSENDHALLLVAHRMAVGARRLRLILRDLRSLYDGEVLPLVSANTGAARSQSGGAAELTGSALIPVRIPGEELGGPGEPGLHRWFERVAATAPDRVALSDSGRLATYRELDLAANRLARRLRDAGVDPRSRVAVDLPLSAEAVAAHLAVLKLGAACLPCAGYSVDCSAEALLRVAAPAALITASRGRRQVPPFPSIVIDLSDAAQALDTVSSEPLGVAVPDDQVAVVAVGGEERAGGAVPLTHGGVTNLLAALRREIGSGHEARVLAIGPLGPRELIFDIFLPLVTGATVVLAGDADAATPDRLCATLESQAITRLRVSPARWEALIGSGWRGKDDLQALCDARQLEPRLAAAVRVRVARLRTLYGHLETTVCCASAEVTESGRVVVGEPLGGTALHLLDNELQPVPTGGVGSIFVGGAGVVRGYLRGAAEYPDAFLPDPFSPDGRGLLFRTGDSARLHPDGSLELLLPTR